jgi:hypothetical protein
MVHSSLDLPPDLEVESLLHLMEHKLHGTASRARFLALEDSRVRNGVYLLFAQLIADSFHALHRAQRKLDLLYDADPGRLRRLGDLTEHSMPSLAQSVRWYLATTEPERAPQQTRNSIAVEQALARFYMRNPQVAKNEQAANAASRPTIQKPRCLGDAIRDWALPGANKSAGDYIDEVWTSSPREFLFALDSGREPDAGFNGILIRYVRSKKGAGYDRLILQILHPNIYNSHNKAIEMLARIGPPVIPALADMIDRRDREYRSTLERTVEMLLHELVHAVVNETGASDRAMTCLHAVELKHGEFTRLPCRSRNDGGPSGGVPVPSRYEELSLAQAVELDKQWDFVPYRNRPPLIKELERRIESMVREWLSAQTKHIADIKLTATRVVKERDGRSFVQRPATPVIAARQLMEAHHRELRHARFFLRYLCQARLCGDLREFAESARGYINDWVQ